MSGVAVMGRSRRASGRGGTPASVFRAQGRQQPARWGVLVGVRGRRDHRGPRTGGRVPQWSGPARATARPQLQVGGPRRHRTGRDLGTPGQRVATLEQAVSPLAASSIAELDDDQIRAELTSVEDVERRPRPTLLPARRGTDRPVSKPGTRSRTRPGDHRAARQAERRSRDELREQLRWTDTEFRRAPRLGARLTHSPASGRVFDPGQLPASQRIRGRCVGLVRLIRV
jgi:hypothetical protein